VATLAQALIFDGLSLILSKCTSPKKQIPVSTACGKEISLFGEGAGADGSIVTVHAVGQGSLSQVPYLNYRKITLI
jgi:hypothetical protein